MSSLEIIKYIKTRVPKEKRQNYLDIIELTENKGRRVAYHGPCTDGAISAALLKHLNEGEVFIPLNYDILYDSTLRQYLRNLDWHAIIDLEPFNTNQIDLYVDHHRSVIGSPINARRIHFESGASGPSAAWVLYQSQYEKFPFELQQLAEVSRITDTASYGISPPIENVNLNSIESILEDFDQLCWFIQDGIFQDEEYSVASNNQMVEGLAIHGLKLLINQDTIDRINKLRENRKKTYEYADGLKITSLMILVNSQDKSFQQTLALYLGKRGGAKVIVFLNERENNVTISLRQSKNNSKEEIEKYRLDLLAKKLSPNGGGHAEAAGSATATLSDALLVIDNWGKEKKLEKQIIELNIDLE